VDEREPRGGRGAHCSDSSIGEEIGVLWPVPARTMRATAAECMLPFTSQAIRKHLRDRGVGAGVAPDFMAERNSELVDIRDGAPTTPSVPSLAEAVAQTGRGGDSLCRGHNALGASRAAARTLAI
jgi:hypothetical protein